MIWNTLIYSEIYSCNLCRIRGIDGHGAVKTDKVRYALRNQNSEISS